MYKQEIPHSKYLTHGIHSYTAKTIPQISRYLITKYSKKNSILLDPFCGSGTNLVESKNYGIDSIGIDLNPLATLISKVKTTNVDINSLSLSIKKIINEIDDIKKTFIPNVTNINYWFMEDVIDDLGKIKYLLNILKNEINEDIFNILLVCFSSIIRRCSNADLKMAKTHISKKKRKNILNGWKPTPILEYKNELIYVFNIIKKFNKLIITKKYNNKKTTLLSCDAKSYLKTTDNFFDVAVTSPPYINAQDYFRTYKLELMWLELADNEHIKELKKYAFGTERLLKKSYDKIPNSEIKVLNEILYKIHQKDKKKPHIISKFFIDIDILIKNIYNKIDDKGHLCIVIGDNKICNQIIPTHDIIPLIAEKMGFKIIEIGYDKIRNRYLSPIRNHNANTINYEWILVFQKI